MTTWKDTKDRRIKKRGDTYWARFMKNGQHIQKSLKTQSFEIARRLADNIEGDLALGISWKRETELFDTAWPEFLIDKAKGVKTKKARPKTMAGYVGCGERFYMPAFKDLRLAEVNDEAWVELVDALRAERPDLQFDNIRKYLMGFLSWAYRKGKIRVKPELFDPDVDRRAQREEDGPGVAYTKEQLKLMRDKAEGQSPRFYLFVLMAQYMGMRPGEITQLKRDRIDLGDRVIRLRRADTKTARPRVVPIHPIVLQRLEDQLARAGESPYLFPNKIDQSRPMDPTGFKRYWNEISAMPEIEGRIYDFRHTFITHALTAGMNPIVVATMTGTSLRMIEKRYLHISAQDLNRDIERFTL